MWHSTEFEIELLSNERPWYEEAFTSAFHDICVLMSSLRLYDRMPTRVRAQMRRTDQGQCTWVVKPLDRCHVLCDKNWEKHRGLTLVHKDCAT